MSERRIRRMVANLPDCLSVPWDLLADAAKGPLVWKAIARQMGPQALRRNPDRVVIPFDTRAYDVRADPGDTILSLSERLARYGGGGTDCSIPLREANTKYGDRRRHRSVPTS